jgi:hypothetical protein
MMQVLTAGYRMVKMDNSHKTEFMVMVNVIMDLMNRPPLPKEAIIVWWHSLKDFDINVVRAAFNKWADTESKAPTPAQIKEMCKPDQEVFKALPKPRNREHQAILADNVRQFIKNNLNRKERDWVKHHEDIIRNPHSEQKAVDDAKRALINLGKPWKGG